MMKNNLYAKKTTTYSYLLAGLLILVSACKKADNFYTELQGIPEITDLDNVVYGIGDTITFKGRLNPDKGLSIRIGDADAEIVKTERVHAGPQHSGHEMDQVKAIITESMGIGSERLISITSSNNTIEAPAIEIIASSDQGIIPEKTKLVQHATKPTNTVFLYGVNGKGTVYLWDADNKTIKRIRKDGTTETVFLDNGLTDQTSSFSIATFHGGGLNPQETQLYFSATTTDATPDNASNTIFRIIRVDLETGNYTVLNRTLVPKEETQRTLQTVTPFEGAIADVKLPTVISNIYPDSKGNLYLISTHAISRLDANGNLQILYKLNLYGQLSIYNTALARPYNNNEITGLLPGMSGTAPYTVSPEDNVMYSSSAGSGRMEVTQTDPLNRYTIYTFSPTWANSGQPYISGSFAIINEVGSAFSLPTRAGMLPLPGQRIISLYYQGRTGSDFTAFPAWGILDFSKKRTDRYAPGKVEMGGYELRSNDLILNYDEDGMLYATANGRSVLVKTIKQ